MADFERTVRDTIDEHGLLLPEDSVVIGVSGGADSLALLHVLRRLAPEYRVTLHVGHLEHGIRGDESLEDARCVRAIAEAWGLPVTIARRDVPAIAQERGIAIEEAARQERYRFLGELARSVGGTTVAVAHHADDQVETVLMHLLRGAGLSGLRGMRPLSRLDALRLGDDEGPPPEDA
ncbi:MAG: tRNA lysidine(34) synthetase TilS, partial [Chloroflexi bacterium]|nr:tRNA lysidine(34) synthetase TilS [Chloroflexota bacterium]